MTPSIAITLSVIVAAFISFAIEWVPADLTALITAVVLMLLGLVTPEEGVAGFSNTATLTVLAMFILSSGVARTGAVLIARDWLMQLGGNQGLRRKVMSMGLIVGPITGFINNTAVLAVFLPIIEDFCHKQKLSPSKLLMPLSYVTVLGGMLTVIGTSTNILASGLSKQLGFGEFSMFQFTALGIITFCVGLGYLTIAGPLLLPTRKTSVDGMEEEYHLADYVTEVVITPNSNLIGRTIRNSELQRKFDVDVLELIRDNGHFAQPVADKILRGGDILLIRSRPSELLKLRDERGLELLPDVKFQHENWQAELDSGEAGMGEVLILSNSRLVGSSLKELRFRQRYNATVLAIRRGQELMRVRLGQVRLRFGDLLLVQGPKQSLIGLQTSRELLMINQRDAENLRRDRAWVAIAIILGVVVLAAIASIPIVLAALIGVVLMVLTGCLRAGEIYGAVRWDVIFLLAGLIPLGTAMENSGTTAWLAQNVLAISGHLSSYWLLVLFYLLTAILTEVLSNNATVVLMLPIAVEVAKALGTNPLLFMYVVTFAASSSFMTPIGYQTNTLVYGPGGYRFLDFTRLGAPLSALLMLLTPWLIMHLYG